ncbi:PREDICTED: tachykinin-3-like [Chrysochloris asiatica]|uniref:Tachykinin-3-like n=1 Tax=Chrysochloris asiatica TaxID=185453 RepID=A0A9B0WL91_CHRAS|nr:PREDICTED: tachykinin-3-like [Chrysochloris asiatica]
MGSKESTYPQKYTPLDVNQENIPSFGNHKYLPNAE